MEADLSKEPPGRKPALMDYEDWLSEWEMMTSSACKTNEIMANEFASRSAKELAIETYFSMINWWQRNRYDPPIAGLDWDNRRKKVDG
jgi:hypothetical protein